MQVFTENAKRAFKLQNERRRVRLVSQFAEVGDMKVEVTEDMWAEVLPELAHVEVVLDKEEVGGGGIWAGRGDGMRVVGGLAAPGETVPQRTTYPSKSFSLAALVRTLELL